ncbi:hypothetical protein C8J57DRAFT_1233295 [Mycena rebaudengoi]|nr:hypothetical protein C8J57DRAFT_1233295 [Mycena rebaudengoi]
MSPFSSPFAKNDAPPPPVVMLLLHTDLDLPASTDLLIHEDLGNFVHPVANTKKKVEFAPTPTHTYPPPPTFTTLIPSPSGLTTKSVENHPGWLSDAQETKAMKKFIGQDANQLCDTSKSIENQKQSVLDALYLRAANQFPILHKYEDNWGTYVITQAHLKNTANRSNRQARKKVTDVVAVVVAEAAAFPVANARKLRSTPGK